MNELVTQRLILRALRADDAAAMFAYRADPEVARYQSWEPNSPAEVTAFIADCTPSSPFAPGTWSQLGIVLRDDGRLIGDCGVHLLDDVRQAELGITVAPPFQGKGYATEALRAVLGLLFDERGTHRVFGSVDPRNTASAALLARAGFRKEAHLVQSLWFKGEWADDVIFAILEREWFVQRESGA